MKIDLLPVEIVVLKDMISDFVERNKRFRFLNTQTEALILSLSDKFNNI